MSRYIDGYILPLPKKNIDAYRKPATTAGKVWKEHGALEYVECIAEDVKPGKVTSFPQAVKLEPDETVVFGWVVYKSRAERDRINALVMKDPRLAGMIPRPCRSTPCACSGAASTCSSRRELLSQRPFHFHCHPRESWGPGDRSVASPWTPAFVG